MCVYIFFAIYKKVGLKYNLFTTVTAYGITVGEWDASI